MWVPATLPGITSTTYKDMGRMGLSTGGYVYKDVKIPAYCVLGEDGEGFYNLMFGFNAARVLVAAACLGGAERSLEVSRRLLPAALHVRQAARQVRAHPHGNG